MLGTQFLDSPYETKAYEEINGESTILYYYYITRTLWLAFFSLLLSPEDSLGSSLFICMTLGVVHYIIGKPGVEFSSSDSLGGPLLSGLLGDSIIISFRHVTGVHVKRLFNAKRSEFCEKIHL